MAMYSAAITPHLGGNPRWVRVIIGYFLVDQSYNLAAIEFEQRPNKTLAEKTAYFAGASTPICPLWYLFTYVGALLGEAIPTNYGLDFIVPIAFLAMVAPALRTHAHIAAAFVSITLALALWWVPFNLGLMIAAIAAMMTGAEIERRSA
jgi:predicted branched-subunit amino acid permease